MFDLKSIRRTKKDNPFRLLVYGPHKIGKSTFASCSDNPIFIQTEDGLDDIDAAAFPLCETWQDVCRCVEALYEEHDYKTVVLDSLDWAEQLAQTEVVKDAGVKTIGDIDFGRGYTAARDKIASLLVALNELRENGMNVVMLAHVEVRKFDDPLSVSYDRYQIKLHKSASKLVQEWADIIGFAQLDQMTTVDTGSGFAKDRARSIDTGERVIHFSPAAAYDAGSRYDLPATMPFVWSEFNKALKEAKNG